MAVTNVLLLSQIAGYVMGLILSLCIVVPMSMHKHEFNDHCLLFSQGRWSELDGQLSIDWASNAYCNYVIFVGVFMFIVCCVQIYRIQLHYWCLFFIFSENALVGRLSMFVCRGTDSSFLSAFVEAAACGVACALAVSAALLVTLGFSSWCQLMLMRFLSCEDAAGQAIDKKDGIQTKSFYIEIGSVQFGAWAAFTTWVGLAVFSTLKVCRYHQLENIQVSMYRERQRLVNESPPPAPLDPGRSTPPPSPLH